MTDIIPADINTRRPSHSGRRRRGQFVEERRETEEQELESERQSTRTDNDSDRRS